MAEVYKIKCVPQEDARKNCEYDDPDAKKMFWEFGVYRRDLRSTSDGDIKEINPATIEKGKEGIAKDVFEMCSVDTEKGKMLDSKCLGSLYYKCFERRNSTSLEECPEVRRSKTADEDSKTPRVENSKTVAQVPKKDPNQVTITRIRTLCKEKNIRHAERLIRMGRSIGYDNVELAIHKFINPEYPAPKGHAEFDDTAINNDMWLRMVERLQPLKKDVPAGVRHAYGSVKTLEVSMGIEGFSYDGKGTMVCVDVSDGYAFYLTAEHVVSGKKNHFEHNRFIPGSDLSLVAVPLREHIRTPKPLKLGSRLKDDETFYSIGFGGNGRHPINMSSNAHYAKINGVDNRIIYTSAACPGDSGGAVVNENGGLVGIMQAVGGAETVKSRFTTLAFGDMELIQESLETFQEELREE